MGGTLGQATIQVDGAVATVILHSKRFKSGSMGYHGTGKIETQKGRYQLNVQAVLIGSKKRLTSK